MFSVIAVSSALAVVIVSLNLHAKLRQRDDRVSLFRLFAISTFVLALIHLTLWAVLKHYFSVDTLAGLPEPELPSIIEVQLRIFARAAYISTYVSIIALIRKNEKLVLLKIIVAASIWTIITLAPILDIHEQDEWLKETIATFGVWTCLGLLCHWGSERFMRIQKNEVGN